jgi:hypothetical protein
MLQYMFDFECGFLKIYAVLELNFLTFYVYVGIVIVLFSFSLSFSHDVLKITIIHSSLFIPWLCETKRTIRF